jgi:prepilin-type N-terminal cleavage/methylation domain-containing protein
MDQSQLLLKRKARGFTLIELAISIAILTVGLVGVASMFGRIWGSTSYSEYMIQASTLASEKLEDLNRYPTGDPDVVVTAGNTTAGSLTANTDASVTSNGVTDTVDYFDEVFMDPSAGSIAETIATGTSPNYTYTTTTHNPNGTITTATATSLTAATTNAIQFQRRWLIEMSPTIGTTVMTGMRRITVLVAVQNPSVQPPVQFQLSVVRP